MSGRRTALGVRERTGVSLAFSVALHVAVLAAFLAPRFQSSEMRPAVPVSLRIPGRGAEPAGGSGRAAPASARPASAPRIEGPPKPPRARAVARSRPVPKRASPSRVEVPASAPIESLAKARQAPGIAEPDGAAASDGGGSSASPGSGGGASGGGSGTAEGSGSGAGDLRVACAYCPPPRYPRAAVARRAEGTVQVGFTLTPDGRAGEVEVRRSSGDRELDHAALAVARRSRFRRAAGGGEAARGYLEYQFQLGRRSS